MAQVNIDFSNFPFSKRHQKRKFSLNISAFRLRVVGGSPPDQVTYKKLTFRVTPEPNIPHRSQRNYNFEHSFVTAQKNVSIFQIYAHLNNKVVGEKFHVKCEKRYFIFTRSRRKQSFDFFHVWIFFGIFGFFIWNFNPCINPIWS